MKDEKPTEVLTNALQCTKNGMRNKENPQEMFNFFSMILRSAMVFLLTHIARFFACLHQAARVFGYLTRRIAPHRRA